MTLQQWRDSLRVRRDYWRLSAWIGHAEASRRNCIILAALYKQRLDIENERYLRAWLLDSN